MPQIEQLPDDWKDIVLPILQRGDEAAIDWTLRAETDWQQFGMRFEGLEYLIRVLKEPVVLALPYPSMTGASRIYAFPGPHPLGVDSEMYAKIGIKDDGKQIKIFSLHIDLTGDLRRQINTYLKQNK